MLLNDVKSVCVDEYTHFLYQIFWHQDGYEKLTPFGFAVHEWIDGWMLHLQLRIHLLFQGIFLQVVKSMKVRIRSDDGTGNSLIEAMQIAIRSQHDDEYTGLGNYRVATSPANQKNLRRAQWDTKEMSSLRF